MTERFVVLATALIKRERERESLFSTIQCDKKTINIMLSGRLPKGHIVPSNWLPIAITQNNSQ